MNRQFRRRFRHVLRWFGHVKASQQIGDALHTQDYTVLCQHTAPGSRYFLLPNRPEPAKMMGPCIHKLVCPVCGWKWWQADCQCRALAKTGGL